MKGDQKPRTPSTNSLTAYSTNNLSNNSDQDYRGHETETLFTDAVADSDCRIAILEQEEAAQRRHEERIQKQGNDGFSVATPSTLTDSQSDKKCFGRTVRLHANLMRVRSGGVQKVTNMELFFDLVFVYAISAISETLFENLIWETFLEMLLITLAVWWAWVYTAWITNWFNPDSYLVRLLLLTLMLASLILSSVIPEAFGEQSVLFACMFVAIQLGRTTAVILCLHGHRLQMNFVRIFFWELLASICWIVGAVIGGNARNIIWTVGVAFDYISPWSGYYTPGLGRSATNDWTIHGGHLSERCSLFIILALGESIVVTGEGFLHVLHNPAGVGTFMVAFVGATAMWWIYFHSASDEATEFIENSDDPGEMGRLAYTYIHVLMVGGIILSAVADRISMEDPYLIPAHENKMVEVAVMIGGPTLFVFGHALFRMTFCNCFPRAHVATVVVLLCLTPMAIHVPIWITALTTTSLLLILSFYESYWRCMIVHHHTQAID
ncbi:hypothetical protein K7432_014068 [Basidiobolus ranarum]|uniref:Low temperature requirement A n=1 Tax=Basidiobolus ranarum TaxID=34480 RepID=A0ABR2WI56_9FUNG